MSHATTDGGILRHGAAATETLTPERCTISEWSNDDADPALSIARARVAPGVWTRWHHLHGIVERYVILEGHGQVEVGDAAPQAVVAGDVVQIDAGLRQRIHNDGEVDLLFLALCTPRFRWDAYEDIDTPHP
ncbi:cupin domain-containing protein [Solimonas marina]|uniref:Cupin domain-containing protein n=1 Tax=Solimonas marina TaxID=2714601 RepID=A0A970B7I0_9GAMM|nr:cupin domain-containing protein [Solimonas marina]NKF23690.1 cupin domain-containing protein [Solimonas marina]